jgi:hypothetical protein
LKYSKKYCSEKGQTENFQSDNKKLFAAALNFSLIF